MRAKESSSEEVGRHVVYERNLQKVDSRGWPRQPVAGVAKQQEAMSNSQKII